jgi:8-oxo-dGTP pyrophosphatase MutT (NUDIX family)
VSVRVEVLTGLDLRLSSAPWGFAVSERAAIETHWLGVAAQLPEAWNGAVLICTAAEVNGGRLEARFAQTDFASFVAWRDWGWPDQPACNCFGAPACITTDGALVLGVMGSHTLNAGRTYPPGGSLEPRDVTPDGRVDIRGSIRKELAEETGLDGAAARPGELLAIFDGHRLAVVETLWLPFDFAAVSAIFEDHQQRQAKPELAGIVGVRSSAQIDPTMPPYAQEMIRRFATAGLIG